MGRDVGRDEGREQAEWRDLVARLELQTPMNPADAPWPDRENLRAKAGPGAARPTGASGPSGPGDSGPGGSGPGDSGPGDSGPDTVGAGDAESAVSGDTSQGDSDDSDTRRSGRGSADRGRVIRPAGSTRLGEPAEPAPESDQEEQAAAGTGEPALAGPRDYELDEPGNDDLDEDLSDRYVPPPLPPQPGLDPVAKGAWLALFGGPGYLLVAMLLSWQIPGWAALTAVIAFVAGFVVLVFRLGDGPSKRDGPDQGAVV